MNATGCDVGSPFLVPPDPDVVEHRRLLVDDETMQRLRTPFEADPFDTLEQRVVVLGKNDYLG
jgi:hypothetical protein